MNWFLAGQAAGRLLLLRLLIFVATAAMTGCATLPPRTAERSSEALLEVAGTALAAVAARSAPAGMNGFKLLAEPLEALDARIILIEQAERSLDLQYFIWHADVSGRILLRALRDAAVRGVRVRLLLDDLYTAEAEGLLDALSGFPGIEVRLFNPFPAGRGSLIGRIAASLGDYKRVRHRMHNKLLVADNVVAITGGRNIGDAYLAGGSGNFLDVDVLTMGPIVREMSESFDDYWNSDYSFSGGVFWGASTAAARRERFNELMGQDAVAAAPAPLAASHRPASRTAVELVEGGVSLQVCKARLSADPVEKVTGVSLKDSSATVHERLIQVLTMAERDVYVASPYFVRGQAGLERIKSLNDRGIRLRVLTNSGSATDEPLAHAVYLRYRVRLMQLGVKIKEFVGSRRSDDERDVSGVSASRLHAKLAVVDHRYVYIGSLNFTGRSERTTAR